MKKITWIYASLFLLTCGFGRLGAQNLPGLIGWWQGEGNVVDSVGTNNGSVTTQLSYVPGEAGQAFDFTGGIIKIPDTAGLDPTNVTVQAWVKTTSPGTYRYIICKARGAGGVSYAIYTAGDGGATFFVNIAGGAGALLSPAAPAATVWDGNWHLLTGVFDGTTSHLFLDGAEMGSGTTTAITNGIDYSSPGPLIFADYQVAGGLPYPGALDQVKIFNRALSLADVAAAFANPSDPTLTNGLVSWYKADGNANDSYGINNGIAVVKAFGYGAGKSGQAFFPQGGNAVVPETPVLEPTNLTVQVWVKSVAINNFRYLLSKARGAGGVSYGLYSGGAGGVDFFVNLASGGGTVFAPAATPQQVWDGAWHQLTATYDGSVVNLYLDGLPVGPGGTVPNSNGIDYSSPGPLVFGDYQAAGGLPYVGEMDDIKIYNRALSAQEILGTFAGTNLVSWWQANTNANDSVGTNNGSLAGTVNYVAGRIFGDAFSTAGGVVKIADSPSLQVTNITLEAMVSGGAPGANKYIISKSDTASVASYALFTGPGGGLAFTVNLGSGATVSPAIDVATIWDGNFHLVDGIYDGSAVHLYVDGSEVGSGTAASGQIQYGASQSSGELLFGDFTDTLSSANFNGRITAIKLYNTALSALDVYNNAFQQALILPLANQSVNPGATVTFTASVQGTPPFTYQWQFHGTNLAGATNATLVITNTQMASAGPYDVVVRGGSIKYTTGVVGQAFQFGAGGLVRISDAGQAFDLQTFSLQAYVRAVAPGTFKYVISKSRDPSYYSSSYGMYTGGGGNLIMFVVLQPPPSNTNAFAFVTAQTPDASVWDGNWHQITGTWDGEFVTLYVDGVQIQSTDSFGGTIDYETYFLNGDLLLGDVLGLPSPYHFPGDVDEAKFFNAALTSDQVLDTFTNAASTYATNGLVSWWKAEGNTLDSWGNHNGQAVPPPGFITSNPATLTVTLPPATIGQLSLTGGNFQGSVTGPNGQTYVVQRNNSLTGGTWVPIFTNTVPFTFTDPINGNTKRFYRAVSQP